MAAIRSAYEHDAPALLEIYRPHVEQTTASFEISVPSLHDFRERVARTLLNYEWLVAETDGVICDYAYATAHRPRAAYRWSVETSAYIHETSHRCGIATALYQELFDRLARKGFCNAFAGITLPNDSSVAFHRHCGFVPIGIFERVGHKFGAWRDVAWFQRPLRDNPPEEPLAASASMHEDGIV